MAKCELCGGYGGHPPDRLAEYRVPDRWDTLCRDCAAEVNTHTLDDMDIDQTVAAIIELNHGYSPPGHAEQHVQQYRQGKTRGYCEFVASCYRIDDGEAGGDLLEMLEDARRLWCRLEHRSPRKAASLLRRIQQWRELEQKDDMASMGVSMSYPVGGL